jgi:hypothetical protein
LAIRDPYSEILAKKIERIVEPVHRPKAEIFQHDSCVSIHSPRGYHATTTCVDVTPQRSSLASAHPPALAEGSGRVGRRRPRVRGFRPRGVCAGAAICARPSLSRSVLDFVFLHVPRLAPLLAEEQQAGQGGKHTQSDHEDEAGVEGDACALPCIAETNTALVHAMPSAAPTRAGLAAAGTRRRSPPCTAAAELPSPSASGSTPRRTRGSSGHPPLRGATSARRR